MMMMMVMTNMMLMMMTMMMTMMTIMMTDMMLMMMLMMKWMMVMMMMLMMKNRIHFVMFMNYINWTDISNDGFIFIVKILCQKCCVHNYVMQLTLLNINTK